MTADALAINGDFALRFGAANWSYREQVIQLLAHKGRILVTFGPRRRRCTIRLLGKPALRLWEVVKIERELVVLRNTSLELRIWPGMGAFELRSANSPVMVELEYAPSSDDRGMFWAGKGCCLRYDIYDGSQTFIEPNVVELDGSPLRLFVQAGPHTPRRRNVRGILYFQSAVLPDGSKVYPPNSVIDAWAERFDAVIPMHHSVYRGGQSTPPYVPDPLSDFISFARRCERAGLAVCLYTSPFDAAYKLEMNWKAAVRAASDLIDLVGVKVPSLYIDGAWLFDYRLAERDPRSAAKLMRSMRHLCRNGWIVLHASHSGDWRGIWPAAEAFADVVVVGENNRIESADSSELNAIIDRRNTTGARFAWLAQGRTDLNDDEAIQLEINLGTVPIGFVNITGDNREDVTFSNGFTSWLRRREELERGTDATREADPK